MSKKLDGKIAVVTGASAGIGLGVAKAFAAEGAKVYITGRRQSELDKALAEIGHGAVGVQGDAANMADVDKLFAQVKATDGRIDVLALNAGFYEFAKFGEITEEHFDRHYNTNVKGLLFTLQKALPLLPKGASVILTGSIASQIGIPAMSVYSSTKAAIRSLIRGWIHDTKELGFRINVLSPGHTLTPGLKTLLPAGAEDHVATTIPLGRLGTPADLGKAAVFLASSDSEYIHGIELEVDGGVSQI
ncbi:SDR family oxidoreductase [Mesorhizobium sp. M7A.F.Ca.US.014.04.1.1]|uniref:SDR family NAD(P)-dependent oxidoreductase n=1 Tax=Mesorhizobium TaxID=68287 RepID=UPI0007A9411D|nr:MULTISPECIES: SDR family oxidoreductase [Mesorhizobium]AMX97844.1 oxidoreductase [Mesorhizobium ciceri]MDF3233879.1 SDR family oxidoreductase [Mesorhizobium sp. DSM 30133]RUU16442.1 SDR family oxidoreductase [Mesorhizobium sp. Primo-B]RUU34489.1 SDR family oxidoreductase [Mesorhizobium sp. Primo-A]RUX57427.1 SDR family oxidoreductase [Mesorhizobium sp. M7A.F.Ca.US.014.04.1.1]